MHHCLRVPEILSQILWELLPTDKELRDDTTDDDDVRREEDEGLRALVALAVTCRILYEPTMNVLWHTLEDLAPVFKCLPSEIWEEESSPEAEIPERTIVCLCFSDTAQGLILLHTEITSDAS